MASVIPTAPRRARAVLGVLVALLLTTAARPGPVSPAELRVGVARLPAMLDPMAALTPTELMLVRLVFEGLVAVGDKGEIEPALASGWTLSRDGLTWTFRLRDDLRLSTGEAVRTDDVVTALVLRLGVDEPSEPAAAWVRPFRGGARVVQEVRRGDGPASVQIQLSKPYAPLLAVLAHPALAVAVPGKDKAAPLSGTDPQAGCDDLVVQEWAHLVHAVLGEQRCAVAYGGAVVAQRGLVPRP